MTLFHEYIHKLPFPSTRTYDLYLTRLVYICIVVKKVKWWRKFIIMWNNPFKIIIFREICLKTMHLEFTVVTKIKWKLHTLSGTWKEITAYTEIHSNTSKLFIGCFEFNDTIVKGYGFTPIMFYMLWNMNCFEQYDLMRIYDFFCQ